VPEQKEYERYEIDAEAYHRRCQTGPCFICRIVARDPAYPADIVYKDEVAIAFLDKYPRLYGWTLVAPRAHREQVTGDFTIRACKDEIPCRSVLQYDGFARVRLWYWDGSGRYGCDRPAER
jgi:hypothetical protein